MIYRDHFCIMFLSPHIVWAYARWVSIKKGEEEKISFTFFCQMLRKIAQWKCFLFILNIQVFFVINLCKSSWVLGCVNEVLFNGDNEERPRILWECAYAPLCTFLFVYLMSHKVCVYLWVFFVGRKHEIKDFLAWSSSNTPHIKLSLLLTFFLLKYVEGEEDWN